jgi:hypothetical protein
MGFAAILLGLAVDYAVVHYQEAVAHPDLSVPEVRRAIAPGIFWAAATTISAFLVLNLGGLPGLAQLGTLVAVGVALSAVVMIFAYLPPLFPARRAPRPPGDLPASDTPLRAGPARIAPGTAGNLPARAGWPLNRARMTAIFGLTRSSPATARPTRRWMRSRKTWRENGSRSGS